MSVKLKYTGEVSETGGLKIHGRKGFDNDLLAFVGKRITIEVCKYRKERSLSQNAYYHACVVPTVRDGLIDAGFNRYSLSNEVVHEMLKQKFLKEDVANYLGEFITITKSTTQLSTSEFMDYIAEIQQWATEFLNIYIPDPMEQSQLKF